MQYDPKLKKAIAEIKDILSKYDIGALVILHSPGFSEYLNHIETSYSCLKFEGANLRFKSKGYTKKQVSDTVNMVVHIHELAMNTALNYGNLKSMLKKHMEIDEGDGRHTGHIDQNN